MMHVPFKQVDVFTSVPYKGNPVAVVLCAGDMTADQMQQIANWTNLSETTFVVPTTDSRADYRVRIFTPGSELPFAGHPTVGTAHALLEAGYIDGKAGTLVQECDQGLVTLTLGRMPEGERCISFDLPEPAITPLDGDRVAELEAALGVEVVREFNPCLIDVGPRWITAQLPSAEAVLSDRPDFTRMKSLNVEDKATGVVIFGEHAQDSQIRIEVRAFAPAVGVIEDPVCGSGNGCVAAFIRHTGQAALFGSEYTASQGAVLGRAGIVRHTIADDRIQVGGAAVTCIDGRLTF